MDIINVSEILPDVKTIFEIKVLSLKFISYPVLPYEKTPCKQGKLRSQAFCNSWHQLRGAIFAYAQEEDNFNPVRKFPGQAQYPQLPKYTFMISYFCSCLADIFTFWESLHP